MDQDKSDFSFEIKSYYAADKKYRMSSDEGYMKVKTLQDLENPNLSDMVLIENVMDQKRGYVPYSFIRELKEVTYYYRK